jgi:hypothetical protein
MIKDTKKAILALDPDVISEDRWHQDVYYTTHDDAKKLTLEQLFA